MAAGSNCSMIYPGKKKTRQEYETFPGLHNNPYLRAAALAKWETKSATRKYKR